VKRLTPAKVMLLMFVVIGGLVVTYIGKSLLAEPPTPSKPIIDIPMALTDLAPGTMLTDKLVGLGHFDARELEWDMVKKSRIIVGRIVKEHIPMATPLRTGQFYPHGEGPPLTDEVGEGMRAVAVTVGESTALVDGLIRPGEYVDVHLTITRGVDERLRGGLTMTLFKGVRIIAINSKFNAATIPTSGNSVTLELTPEQANIVILARQRGELTFSFNPNGKGDGGVAVKDENRATLEEILGLKPIEEEEEIPEPPPFTSEIYRRDGFHVNQFVDGKRIRSQSHFARNPSRGSQNGPATPNNGLADPDDAGGAQDAPGASPSGNGSADDGPVDLPPPPPTASAQDDAPL
jgi:pilus assembly protein CpaB